MLERFLSFADEYGMLPQGAEVLAAVSGGADSMCLLSLLLEAAQERSLSIAAAHFNHCLRGGESDRDERFVREFCEREHVPYTAGSGDVSVYAEKHGLGTEEAARILRYDFLEKTAGQGSLIATAHNADDNAETVILNLTRGSGLRGLGGIPPVRGRIIRPILCFTRSEIEEYLGKNGIPHVEDSTNAEDIYARNRIRHIVMPVLREINPNVSGTIGRSSKLLRTDEEYFSSQADAFFNSLPDKARIPADKLLQLPASISSRVIRAASGERNLSACHVQAVLKLCESEDPSASVSLPGITVSREYGSVVFSPQTDGIQGFSPVTLSEGESAEIPELNLRAVCTGGICTSKIHKSFTVFLFKKTGLCGRIIIRPRLEGDSIAVFGRSGTKTLKKLFIEEHIPARKRSAVPVIADEAGVIAVPGIGTDRRVFAQSGDEIIKIEFEEIIQT